MAAPQGACLTLAIAHSHAASRPTHLVEPAEKLAIMTALGQLRARDLHSFFTAQGYGQVHDAKKLEYSSRAKKVAAVIDAARRDGEDERLLAGPADRQ